MKQEKGSGSIKRPVIQVIAVLLLLLFSAGLLSAGGSAEQSERNGEKRNKLTVYASVLPHRTFIERIGGDRVDAAALIPEGADPHTYEPTPRQVQALGDASLYFRTGLPFEEAFLDRIRSSLPDLRIVDLREGVKLREIEGHEHEEEAALEDEPEVEHDEDALDPHVWLAPEQVLTQADTIMNNLIQADPEGESLYRSNTEAFKAEVQALHQELSEYLEPVRGQTVLVYHPAFGYFTDSYGLHQEAVETGGDEPAPRRLRELIEEAKAEGVSTIFVQPEFSRRSAETIARAVGGRVVVINLLAPEWFETMRRMAEAVRQGASSEKRSP